MDRLPGSAGNLIEQLEAELKTCKSGLRGLMEETAERDTRTQKEMRERIEFIRELEEQIEQLRRLG
ncbi:MAG: hypothetical protein U1E51_28710 [Candidatus Binatia bacterium]|nr:hypothetical protein [Candidatus Binatia bacterium]